MPKVTRSGFIPKSSGLPARMRRGKLTAYMDTSEFEHLFGVKLTKDLGDSIVRGLGKAGKALMDDTVADLPTTPILTSALRASGAVFVDGKKVADSSQNNVGGAKDFQAATAEATATSTTADIVFNAPYAAIQHEEFPVKSEPTAGMKYMETKLVENALKYFGIVADEVKL